MFQNITYAMTCIYCNGSCIKKGFQKNGNQKLFCKKSIKWQQVKYSNRACHTETNIKISTLVKEGCGIRSIGRILKISPTTTIARIKQIAKNIKKPLTLKNKTYEVDELRTFVGNKTNLYWVVCAYERETKKIIDFNIGKRTKRTLQAITSKLEFSHARKIFTDGLLMYKYILSKSTHSCNPVSINRIERMNLNLRTHLKRLNRRTICFTRSAIMLFACLKIYFWG